MIKSRTLTVILILITIIVLFWAIKYALKGKSVLVNPAVVSVNSTIAPLASPDAPKQFKFDRSTNLNKELDNINPQVLDSDF